MSQEEEEEDGQRQWAEIRREREGFESAASAEMLGHRGGDRLPALRMTSRIKVLVSYGGRIVEGEHGADYEGRSHRVVFLQESFEYSDLVESISQKLELRSNDVISDIIYRLPCMSNGVIHYYCMEVKDGDDICALVDSIVVVESTSYSQLYVKTRKYRVKNKRSVCTQEAELGGRQSIVGSLGLLHEPVMQSGRHSVYAPTSELIGDPFILPSRHNALSEAPFKPSLGASIFDKAGPSHEVMESFHVLSNSDVPLPESIGIPIATNDCQSNPSKEEDSDGLLGQDDCEEEAMIKVPEAFQFTVGANYPISADWIGLVGNTVRMVVGTEFDTTLEFQEKKDVINAVKLYSLNCSREYEVAKSSSRVWSVVCRNTKYGCSWQLRAARLKKLGGGWGITRYKGPHTCVARAISLDHRQLDSNFICNCILEGVKKDPSKSVGSIIVEIHNWLRFKPSYRKAWEAKQKTIARIWVIDNIEFTKLVIQIDGTFLYGKYKHSLLIATTIDGDNSMIPLAYALVESENVDS
ncbi:hypothetical protein ZIOFF_015667 [Zingiber officinale]|uniref:Transposase MuDR plant domain-containing protein n=1 Tax=Zingiber officinale TaxID=94328 RepID=A0A8J5HIV9_ZINOF|nr:hypothetical protein ZIOFF_015667 [Zingiber officinale]